MNPLDWFKRTFARLRGDDPRREVRFLIPYSVSGLNLTADESLSLATVWACVDVIARNIASCKWHIYEPTLGTKRRKLLDDDMRTYILNTRPNPEMTAIGWRESMLYQCIPFGNSYSEIVRDRAGRVAQLWPLISERMRPRRSTDGKWSLVYEYTQPDGTVVFFTPDQILHFRGPGLYGLMGENIIARAAKTISIAAAQERFGASFFGQGMQPSGTLEYPGKISPERHAQLKEDWSEKMKGPENSHKPLLLEGGMKWTPLSFDPVKSQMVESRRFQVEEICRWFGVPPHKVQHLDHATFSNIEHSSIEFVRDALVPWERRLCQEVDAKLFDQTRAPWRYTCINLSPLTRGDSLSRAQAEGAWVQNGIMTRNEVRAEEGLDDAGPDGDILLVQSNLTTVERIIEPPAPPALPGQAPQPGGETGEGDDDDTIDSTNEALDGPVEARRVLIAALRLVNHRYEKRLANQRARLSGKTPSERGAAFAKFRAEQQLVMYAEVKFFSEFATIALGREFTEADVSRMMELADASLPIEAEVVEQLKQLKA